MLDKEVTRFKDKYIDMRDACKDYRRKLEAHRFAEYK